MYSLASERRQAGEITWRTSYIVGVTSAIHCYGRVKPVTTVSTQVNKWLTLGTLSCYY